MFLLFLNHAVPSPPDNTTAVALGSDAISVSWDPAPNDHQRYEVTYYPTSSSERYQVEVSSSSELSVDISELTENTEYEIEVRTISGSGDSEERSEASTTSVTTGNYTNYKVYLYPQHIC